MEWKRVSQRLPPQGRTVVLLTTESLIPVTGYWKNEGEGVYWVIAGKGRTPQWWCDCIPVPYPQAGKEQNRERYLAILAKRAEKRIEKRNKILRLKCSADDIKKITVVSVVCNRCEQDWRQDRNGNRTDMTCPACGEDKDQTALAQEWHDS